MSAYQPLTSLKGGDKEMVSGPSHLNFGGYGNSAGNGGFGASLSSAGRPGAGGAGLFNALSGSGGPTPPVLLPGGGCNPLNNPPSTSSMGGGSVSSLAALRGRSITPVPHGGGGFNGPPSLQQQSHVAGGLSASNSAGGLGVPMGGSGSTAGIQSLQSLFLPSGSTGYGASLQLPGGRPVSTSSGPFNPLSLNTVGPPGSAPSQQLSPNSRNLYPSVPSSLGSSGGGSSNLYGQGSFGVSNNAISGMNHFSSTLGSGINPNRFGSGLDSGFGLSGNTAKDSSGYNRNQIGTVSSEAIRSMLNSGASGSGLLNMNSMMGSTGAPLGLSESEFPSLGGGVGGKLDAAPASIGAGAPLSAPITSVPANNNSSTPANHSVSAINLNNNNFNNGNTTNSTNNPSNISVLNNNPSSVSSASALSSSGSLATTQTGGFSSQHQQLLLMGGSGGVGANSAAVSRLAAVGGYGSGTGGNKGSVTPGPLSTMQHQSGSQLQQQHQLAMSHPGLTGGGVGGGSVNNSNNQISIGGGVVNNPGGGIVGGGRSLSSVGGFGMGVGGGGSGNPSSTGGPSGPLRIQHSQSVGSPQITSSNFSGGFYSGLIKNTEPSEFQINNEDFPALQGTQNEARPSSAQPSIAEPPSRDNARYPGDKSINPKQQQGIQTAPDGIVTNIPPCMIRDQFGMVGMLTLLRALETDPAIVNLAVGMDLTGLGLNLNASERGLFRTFGGPWQSVACRPQDMDATVPPEYLTNMSIQERLAPIRLNRYGEDLLFFLFYMYCGDMFQLATAAELYNRDWRYSKVEGVWVTRAPGAPPKEKTSTYECGTYYVFDPVQWRKVTKEMRLDYDTLEDRPTPVSFMLHQRPTLSASGIAGGLLADQGGGQGSVLNGVGPHNGVGGGAGMLPPTNSVHTPVPSVGGMMMGGGVGMPPSFPSVGGGNHQPPPLLSQQQMSGGRVSSLLQHHHMNPSAAFMPPSAMNNPASISSLVGLATGSAINNTSSSSMLIGGVGGGGVTSSGFGDGSNNPGAGVTTSNTGPVAALMSS